MTDKELTTRLLCVVMGVALGFVVSELTKSILNYNDRDDDDTRTRSNDRIEEIDYLIDYEEDIEQVTTSVDEFDKQLKLFPLKEGSDGEEVNRLQVFLMRKLGWVRKPTGIFDETSLQRVRQYFKVEEVSAELYHKWLMDKMVHDQRKR